MRFILGGAGSGKSTYLCRQIISESLAHEDRQYLVIVPEQFTLQTQQNMIQMHPRHGIMNIDVLSFERLAYRVLEEVGANRKAILRETGKSLLLRRAAGEISDDLTVFGRNFRKIGYVKEMKSLLSEFTQYRLEGARLDEAMEACPEGGRLKAKLQDVALLQEKFREYMGEAYMTSEELLDSLRENAGKSELLRGATLAFDGYTGFTPVQADLLRELLPLASEVYVTAEIDESADAFRDAGSEELFHLSQEMIVMLCKLASECGIPLEEPLRMKRPYPRFQHAPELACLEERLFRKVSTVSAGTVLTDTFWRQEEQFSEFHKKVSVRTVPSDTAVAPQVILHRCRNPREEARFIAAEAELAVRELGLRYRQIGVTVSSMEVYGSLMEEAFREMGIPYFLDRKKDVMGNACVEFLRAAVGLIQEQYSYDSMFRFLKTGFYPMKESQVFLLENYCRAMGIRGYKRWQTRWLRPSEYMTEEELQTVEALRGTLMADLSGFEEAFRDRKRTIRSCTGAIRDLFAVCSVSDRCEELAAGYADSQPALALEYGQIFRVVDELLEQFEVLLGDEPVTIAEFRDLLDAGLAEAEVGIIPPSYDQVLIGDPERTRMGDVKMVFCAGFNDAFLPGGNAVHGIINDRERQFLAEAGVRLAPTEAERIDIQRFYLYLNLTKPSDRLVLSFSNVDMDGQTMRPSCYLWEIRQLLPDLEEIDEVQREGIRGLGLSRDADMRYLARTAGVSMVSPGTVLTDTFWWQEELSSELHKKVSERTVPIDTVDTWKELYCWYSRREDTDFLEKILDAAYIRNPEESLTAQEAEALYGSFLRASATRMELYAACPYAYFLKYGLGLREREEYGFDLPDEGKVLHEALSEYGKELQKREVSWDKIDAESRDRLCSEILEKVVTDFGNSVLTSTARYGNTVNRLEKTLQRTVWALGEQLAAGSFVPEAYELDFGRGKLHAMKLPLEDGKTLEMTGRIDRLDLAAGDAAGDRYYVPGDRSEAAGTRSEATGTSPRTYIKVLDYKTGSKNLEMAAIYYGLDLQLFTYLTVAGDYAAQIYPGSEPVPTGVLYYHIMDPFISGSEEESREPAQIEQEMLKKLRPEGLVVSDREALCQYDEGFAQDGYKNSIALRQGLKKDGAFTADSKVLTPEEFNLLKVHQKKSLQKLGNEILKGNINVSPTTGIKEACEYCNYRQICQFDGRIPGFECRRYRSLNAEEVALKLHAEG